MAFSSTSTNPETDKAGDASMKTLRDDVDALRADLKTLLSDSSAVARAKARKGVAEGERVAEDAKRMVEDASATLEGKVRDNPLAAVAIAFGVGVVLSAISRR